MEFKAFILCFAFFVVTASGSAICKCTQEERKDTVSKYNVKMREGNREVDETIEIDTEKQTEKIHIPSNGDSSNSAPGEVDVVYDFNLNLSLHRLSNQKACFLSKTSDMPKPADLKKLLDLESSQETSQTVTTKENYMIGDSVNDRSFLSDEMAALCAKLPIYRVKAITIGKEASVTRVKRDRICSSIARCYKCCFLFFCRTHCYYEHTCVESR